MPLVSLTKSFRKPSHLCSSAAWLFCAAAFVLWVPLASGAQDCFGGNLNINANGIDLGQVSPGQLGLSSGDVALGASTSWFTQVTGPTQMETVLDGAAYSGLPVWLTPELVSTNDWDWRCFMIRPVNRNNIVVNYQLSSAAGQSGGVSVGGQFVPVTLETEVTVRPVFFFFVEVFGRIRAYPDLSDLTVAGDAQGTLQVEVYEQ